MALQQKLYWPCFVEIFFVKQSFQLLMQQKNTAALPRVVEILSYPKKSTNFSIVYATKNCSGLAQSGGNIFSSHKKYQFFQYIIYMQQKIAAALPRVVEQWKSWQLAARCTWLLQLIG